MGECLARVTLPDDGACCPVCGATGNDSCFEALSRYSEARQLVDQQAEDGGLWFDAETAPEAYLQQELRRLHAVIEGIHAFAPARQPEKAGP